MANLDNAFGAKPIRREGGGNIHVNRYYCNVADALYIGDIVALEGTADTEGVPSVIACTASLIPVGVVVGMEVSKDRLDSQLYKKPGDAVYLLVADSPSLSFEMQVNGTLAATDFGLNADLGFTEGSTVTGRSKMELLLSTKATTGALHMHMRRLAKQPDNEIGADAIVECSWSQHAYADGESAGV